MLELLFVFAVVVVTVAVGGIATVGRASDGAIDASATGADGPIPSARSAAHLDPACPPMGGPTLVVEGLGTVRFGSFATAAGDDAAVFTDGACIDAADGTWTLVGDRIVLRGLRGATLEIEVDRALLRTNGAELRTRRLVGTRQRLVFRAIGIRTEAFVGTAAAGRLDLASGALELDRPVVQTRSADVAAASARLAGDAATALEATLAACRCGGGPSASPLRIETRRLHLDPETGILRAEAATLRLGVARFDLGDVDLDEASIDDLLPPVALGVPDGADALADSTSFVVGPIRLGGVESPREPTAAAGAQDGGESTPQGAGEMGARGTGAESAVATTLEVGLAGLDAPDLAAVGRLRVAAAVPSSGGGPGGAKLAAAFAATDRGPAFEVELERSLAPFATIDAGLRHRGDVEDALVDAELGVRFEASVGLGPGIDGVAYVRPFVAASAEQVADDSVLGPRFGLRSGVVFEAALGGGFELRLPIDAGAALYPNRPAVAAGSVGGVAGQHWLRTRPGVAWTSGGFTARLGYDLRVVTGESPFGSEIDRVGPRHRLAASVDVREVPLGGVSGPDSSGRLPGDTGLPRTELSANAELDLRLAGDAGGPGVEELSLSADVARTERWGTWTAGAAARLDGWISHDASDPIWVEGASRIGWGAARGTGHVGEFAIRARYDIADARLADVDVGVAIPLHVEHVRLRPYLAVDLADLLRHESSLVAHGLEVVWDGCCGAWTVGYEARDGDTSISLGYALPDRPLDPTAGTFAALPGIPGDASPANPDAP